MGTANEKFSITRPVIVGYDGSDESDDALMLGAGIAELLGTELVAATVFDLFEPEPATAAIGAYERAFDAEKGRLETRARSRLGDRSVRMVQVLALSAAHGLHVIAAEADAALVVVGSTHRGAVGRVVPGSMAQRLLAAGPDPVAIAPRGYADEARRLTRFGVGFDGSPESRAAVPIADALARATRGSLTVIGAIEPYRIPVPVVPTPAVGAYEESAEALAARCEVRREEAGRLLVDLSPGIDVRVEIEVGDAAEVLRGRCSDLDLLVLGSRGYGPLRRVLLGTVSARVVANAECPVIVVPRGSSESDERPEPREVLASAERAGDAPTVG
jgi:nucleotide-binding universal stress UspA family protein